MADLRPLMQPVLAERGLPLGLCCHPYDLCTWLIAAEMGVIVTDVEGGRLRAPLEIHAPVAWAGYANAEIHRLVQPVLQELLCQRGLLEEAIR